MALDVHFPALMLSRISAVLIAAALAGGCIADAEEVSQRSQTIVNGQVNTSDPAVGLVYMDGVGTCTGTMVSDKVILTARHCVLLEGGTEVPATDLYLFWGTAPQNGDTPTPVVSYEYHPNADIAVLELSAPGPTTPIVMNTMNLDPYVGEPVRVAGYGVTAENNTDSGTKRVGMTAMFDALLNTELGQVMLIGNEGSQTCYGDSGGPAFMNLNGTEHIVGVTSFGTGPCEQDGTLDGEIRIDLYHSWIMDFITRKDPNGLPAGSTPDPDPAPDPDPTPDPDPNPDPGTTGEPVNSPSDIVGGCSAGGEGSGGETIALLLAVALIIARRRWVVTE